MGSAILCSKIHVHLGGTILSINQCRCYTQAICTFCCNYLEYWIEIPSPFKCASHHNMKISIVRRKFCWKETLLLMTWYAYKGNLLGHHLPLSLKSTHTPAIVTSVIQRNIDGTLTSSLIIAVMQCIFHLWSLARTSNRIKLSIRIANKSQPILSACDKSKRMYTQVCCSSSW